MTTDHSSVLSWLCSLEVTLFTDKRVHSGFCLLPRAGCVGVCMGCLEAMREMTELSMGPIGKDFDFVGASCLNSGNILSVYSWEFCLSGL